MADFTSLPSSWPSPNFWFNQLVFAECSLNQWHKGRIIGLEYMDTDHYSVARYDQPTGWKYTILVDSADYHSRIEPILLVNESQVTAHSELVLQ